MSLYIVTVPDITVDFLNLKKHDKYSHFVPVKKDTFTDKAAISRIYHKYRVILYHFTTKWFILRFYWQYWHYWLIIDMNKDLVEGY